MSKNQIVYSKQVMIQLVERGFKPLFSMPNPTNEKYNCWVFEMTDEF